MWQSNNMGNITINSETINKVCQDGFMAFLKSQVTLKINSIDVSIETSKIPYAYCLVTPNFEIENVLNELYNFGQTNFTFSVICQVNELLKDGGASSIDIYAHNVQGSLTKKDDLLVFQIDSISFNEKGK